MEGRWMLSAMSLDFTTLSLPAITTLQVGQPNASAGQAPQFNIASEGGFISLGNLQTDATGSGTFVLSGIVRSNTTPLTSTTVLGSNSDSAVSRFFGSNSAVSFDLHPAVIGPSNHGTVLQPHDEPIVAGGSWPGTGTDDGGSINIRTILKGDEPDGGFGSGKQIALVLPENLPDPSAAPEPSQRTAARDLAGPTDLPASAAPLSFSVGASHGIDVTLGSSSPDQTSSSIDNAISGEWARAVVFEMAGGEPAWDVPPSVTNRARPSLTPDRADSPHRAAPLPPNATGQQAVHRAAVRHQIAADEMELGVAVSRLTELAGDVRPGAALPSSQQDAGSPETGLSAFNVPDAAYAEVFEQLGRSEKPLMRASAHEDLQSVPIAAAPLLALVVLERVAARYWSRANKEASTVLAGPPRP